MAEAKVEYKKSTDLVKLANLTDLKQEFTSNSVNYAVGPKEHLVIVRLIAEHAVLKTMKSVATGEGEARVFEEVAALEIQELPEGKRTQESLGKSAEEVIQLTGKVDTLEKLIEKKDVVISNHVEEISDLKAQIKKLKAK